MASLKRSFDAHEAGKINRSPCSLYITDDNTRFVFNNNIQLWRYNRNTLGVITFGITKWDDIKSDHIKIQENINLQELKKMLGLRDHLDNESETFYLNPENFKRLRYDQVILMTDNQSLITLINEYFKKYHPSLLKQNFIIHHRNLPQVRARL
jgi:hypothetical protein